MAVERSGHPVFLHTHATNHVAHYLLQQKSIPGLKSAQIVRPEVTVGKSRFDFLLKKNGMDCYLEVKSCTQFGNGVAMFPDAVTQRGRKHILELAQMAREGIMTAVLFLVHHPKVRWFMPDFHTDLAFSKALLSAKNDIQIIAAALGWEKDLTRVPQVHPLKIPWRYVRKEVHDAGSYLLVIHLKKSRQIRVGRLGKMPFSKGYHVYVGSAMKGLSARISRHRNRNKTLHWHIDYLTAQADHILALPIRASTCLECGISRKMASILKPGPDGFGASDCRCPTHLFHSATDPLHNRAFHDMLQSFRMRHPD
jgi:sugar fermentation stimulation protein A